LPALHCPNVSGGAHGALRQLRPWTSNAAVRSNLIRDRSYAFALAVVRSARLLTQQREYVLSRQFLRSGTSIGANVEEALAAQSRRDFLAKLSIARKEARECRYWVRLLSDSQLLPTDLSQPLLADSDAIIRILTSIIITTEQRTATAEANP
jgi:four helix bundle protein